jgi:hypothetical protein
MVSKYWASLGCKMAIVSIAASLAMSCVKSASDKPVEPQGNTAISTALGVAEVVAGQPLTVTCGALKNRKPVSIAFSVDVNPQPAVAWHMQQNSPSSFTFTPEKSGQFVVSCRSGSIRDAHGVNLAVVAGAATRIDTVLASSKITAGKLTTVACPLFDNYENPAGLADNATLQIEPEIAVTRLADLQFSIESTRAGIYNVVCKTSAFKDADPAQLEIAADDPMRIRSRLVKAGSNAGVPLVAATAGEDIGVICETTDRYGNVIEGIAVDYDVVPEQNGGSARLSGVHPSPVANQFNVTVAGDYQVYCVLKPLIGDPAYVRINPSSPAALQVSRTEQDCYQQNLPLPVTVAVSDAFGNSIDPAPVTVISSRTGLEKRGASYVVTQEGQYTLTFSVVGATSPGAIINPVSLPAMLVDSTPPMVSVISPKRGEMLVPPGNAADAVNVVATVHDNASFIEGVEVNDAPMTDIANNVYDVAINRSQPSQFGLNLVKIKAVDVCGNIRLVSQSYLMSTSYNNPILKSATSGQIRDAVQLYLKQALVDDGIREHLGTPANDFVSLIQQKLDSTHLGNSFLVKPMAFPDSDGNGVPDTAKVDCGANRQNRYFEGPKGVTISKAGDINIVNPTLKHIRFGAGTIEAQIAVQSMHLPLSFYGQDPRGFCEAGADFHFPSISGAVDFSQPTSITLNLSLAIQNGVPVVTVCDNCAVVAIASPEITIDDILEYGLLGKTIEELKNQALKGFEADFRWAIADNLKKQLPPMLTKLLTGFEMQKSLVFPQPLTTVVTVAAGFDTMTLNAPTAPTALDGSLLLDLRTQMFPKEAIKGRESARGSIMHRSGAPVFAQSSDYSFGVSLSDDFINNSLWASWMGGAFDVPDAMAMAKKQDIDTRSLGNSQLSIRPMLPPVLMPGKNSHEIEFGFGDLYVEGTVDTQALINSAVPGAAIASSGQFLHLGAYISASFKGRMDFDPLTNQMVLIADRNPRFEIDIQALDDMNFQGVLSDALTNLLKLSLETMLADAIEKIQIPDLDVSSLLELPPGTKWVLKNGSIEHANHHFVITGALK